MTLAEFVERSEPVLGVRTTRERDGSVCIGVAVGAVDDVPLEKIGDTAVERTGRKVQWRIEDRGNHRRLGYFGTVGERECAGMGREVEGVDCPLARRLAARVRLPGDRSGEDHGSGDDASQDGVPARAASTFHRNLDQAPECKRPRDGEGDDQCPAEQAGFGASGDHECKHQNRPVNQVQRECERAEPRQCRMGKRLRRPRRVVADSGQDQRKSGQHRHQRPRAGELLGAVEHYAAQQDRRKTRPADRRSDRERQGCDLPTARAGHQNGQQTTEGQFPQPGAGVVVRPGLVT